MAKQKKDKQKKDKQTTVQFSFPGLTAPAANDRAESLLGELQKSVPLKDHLNRKKTRVGRTDKEALDFGAILIAVLGTSAVIKLAEAVKSWAERTGTTTIKMNGVVIENVKSKDVAEIVKALQSGPPKK